MEKNEVYEGVVTSLGTDGEGIINLEGTTAFVPFCLVGEKVRFKVLKAKGNIAYGKAEEILSPSPFRKAPLCPVFYKCGGCDLQHTEYSAQLGFKRDVVARALEKIGGIKFMPSDTVACEEEYRYRNKLALPIGVDENGRTVCGFYANRSHRIVPVSDCLLQAEWVKDVISAVENFAKLRHIRGYNEQNRTGELRRIVVREIKGKFVFVLVAAKAIDCKSLILELEKTFKDFTFLLNVNSSEGNALFSDDFRVLRGTGFFEAEDCGVKFKAGANTFLQVNDGVREKLYQRVVAEAEEGAVAVDLYSGGGMLTAMLAKKCGEAYGVEIVPEASRCADELKEMNGLQGKMHNICSKVEEKIAEIFAKTVNSRKIIVCDPPRKGMERSAVKAIAGSGADKIILISCNPATLARDLGLILGTLEEDGLNLVKSPSPQSAYRLKYVLPFDMFPQTKWCETLAVLERKGEGK